MVKTKAFAFLSVLALLLFCGKPVLSKNENTVSISLQGASSYHTYPSGEYFSVNAYIGGPTDADVSYFWRDLKGKALSQPQKIKADRKAMKITSPSDETGYYGLVFKANADLALPDRKGGEEREYGFVILPKASKGEASSPFGIVHANANDPYAAPWVKTATWHTTSAKFWPMLMRNVRQNGKIELPLILGEGWESDDKAPVSENFLIALEERAQDYFRADKSLNVWEAGLEETLSDNYKEPFYWKNLEKKFETLKKAARKAGIKASFAYQIVGADTRGIQDFFANEAFRYVDIIALHPYAWPDFSSPDLWLEALLKETARLQTAHKTSLPVWFTEVGAAHMGNAKGEFFGFPSEGKKTGGLSKREAVVFMTKLCVMARARGVEKIFWYNYQDRSPSRQEVESHFGLRDFWGFPKPVYAAYYQISRLLGDAPAAQIPALPQGIKGFRFKREDGDVIVLWSTQESGTTVSLSLLIGDAADEAFRVNDAVGHPVATRGGRITLDDLPLFVSLGKT